MEPCFSIMGNDQSDNWYSKLAKSGWLGTKAQVSAIYGKPAWSSASDDEDPMAQALKRQMKKPTADESSSGG